MSTPTYTTLSVQQVLTKTRMVPMPHPPYFPDLALREYFLFPQMKKVLKGKCFADVEEVKQNTAEALKAIKINKCKTVLSSGKSVSIDVLHQVESTWKMTEVQTCKNKYTLFINEFHFWVPHQI